MNNELKKDKLGYNKVSIEATKDGWIVTENKQETRLYYRWETLLSYISDRLTNKSKLELEEKRINGILIKD